MYDGIKKKIAKTLDEIENKDGMTCRDLELVNELLDAWKDMLTIEAMLKEEEL